MSESELRAFYYEVYRLAQHSVEGIALFTAVQNWFKTDAWTKDFSNAVTNEDLLRVIAMTSRRAGIVTLNILCDDGGQGRRGCTIYKLLRRIEAAKGLSTEKMRGAIDKHGPTIGKIRLLRNNNDAHYNEDKGWEKGLGEGLNSQGVNNLLRAVFAALLSCGKTLNIHPMPFECIFKITFAYGERLIHSLGEQVHADKVGPKFQSVREWEDQDRSEQLSEEEGVS